MVFAKILLVKNAPDGESGERRFSKLVLKWFRLRLRISPEMSKKDDELEQK